ncbi:hypothetical protein [Nocardia xishanensis]
MVQRLIDAVARHIREEQARGRTAAALATDETAHALVWMDQRYLSEALGREPRIVVDVLYNIWMSALYGAGSSYRPSGHDRGRPGRRHRRRPARRQYSPEVDANPRSPANTGQPGGQ